MRATIPTVDAASRARIVARFGEATEAWFAALPDVLLGLAGRWRLEYVEQIPRGSVSAVFRCRVGDERGAILKVSPDRARLAFEASALDGWPTLHTPEVLAVDAEVGALLLEAIEPGVPLDVSASYPDVASVADLFNALHRPDVDAGAYPTVAQRSAYLFESSSALYDRESGVAALVPRELYERGRLLAEHLAHDTRPPVLLHGDLTPSNILIGGPDRGLVAIDPAPCIGDAEFDAVDLLLWQAEGLQTIDARAEALAAATDLDGGRLLDWCRAFAAMNALELVTNQGSPSPRAHVLLELARRPPA